MNKIYKTTDPEEIQRWAEERGGVPVLVHGRYDEINTAYLQIFFREPKERDSTQQWYEPLAWDDFFSKMREKNLAIEYEDFTEDGRLSKTYNFVNVDAVVIDELPHDRDRKSNIRPMDDKDRKNKEGIYRTMATYIEEPDLIKIH